MRKKRADSVELERAWRELKAGQQESAAAAAIEQRSEGVHPSKLLVRLIFKFWGFRIIMIALFLTVMTAGSVWLLSGNTFKKETGAFVEQVQELASLATAQAHMKVVIEQEDNQLFGKDIAFNLPGTKRELMLVVPATVVAGVDLKQVTEEDIQIDEQKRELRMVLPRAELIQEPAIQMDQVRTFSDEGILRSEVKWDEGFDLGAEAQDTIEQEAIEAGLLQTAEQNAVKVLQGFFDNLGYSVKLTFK
jgi:hypothetical protein